MTTRLVDIKRDSRIEMSVSAKDQWKQGAESRSSSRRRRERREAKEGGVDRERARAREVEDAVTLNMDGSAGATQ